MVIAAPAVNMIEDTAVIPWIVPANKLILIAMIAYVIVPVIASLNIACLHFRFKEFFDCVAMASARCTEAA